MGEPAVKKRKVRKGTHSCWECRRRKIKCIFDPDQSICINCVSRGSQCVSQEFNDDETPAAAAAATAPPPPDDQSNGLANRLIRLEAMMGKLVDERSSTSGPTPEHTIRNTNTSGKDEHRASPPADPNTHLVYRVRESEGDLLDSSAVRNAHDITIVNSHSGTTDASTTYDNLPTPESSSAASNKASPGCTLHTSSQYIPDEQTRGSRYRQISHDLHALLPSANLRNILAFESPGATTVLNFLHSYADVQAGKPETPESFASPSYPSSNAHPAILARRLLQYAICLQQMPPITDLDRLDLGGRMPCEFMANWVGAVSSLVIANDDLVGCVEGLECLVLLSMFQGEAGHLRKAWMTARRALNMAQLMGVDRRNCPPLRSCETSPRGSSRIPQPCHSTLWYRIQCTDRYHSLILGLPIGSRNNSFADPSLDPSDCSLDRLGKAYAVLAGRIADRNDLLSSSSTSSSSAEAYAQTQSIDADLSTAAHGMQSTWWSTPDITAALRQPPHSLLNEINAMRLQCRHFTLMILLHLPYLLRDREDERRRYDYNRTTCMHASRAVLRRFLSFRDEYIVYIAGRHVDYSGLIGAMTLMLGHLHGGSEEGAQTQRVEDRELVERAKVKFVELASYKNDRLSQESADTITQMLPILGGQGGKGGKSKDVHLTVPFLGTVNINARSERQDGQDTVPESTAASTQNSVDPGIPTFGDEDFTFDPRMSLSFDTSMPPSQGMGFGGEAMGNTWDETGWMDFSGDAADWAFQGVDTQYWSMLNNSMN